MNPTNTATVLASSPWADPGASMPALPWWRRLGPLLVGLVAVLALGLHLREQGWAAEQVRLRAHLLRQVEGLAQQLDSHLLRELSFDESDAGRPAFQILREQLQALGQEFPNQGLFLLAQRNGQCRLGLDTRVLGPREIASRAVPPEAMAVFQSGRPVVVGPSEAQGAFVSAFAPIRDEATGAVSLVLGLDQSASDWRGGLGPYHWVPDPVYLALSCLFLALAFWLGWGVPRVHTGRLNLRGTLLLPLALMLLALTAAYGWHEIEQARAEQVRDTDALTTLGARRWSQVLATEVPMLRAELDRLAENPALIQAMREGNRNRLEQLAQPIFTGLRVHLGISQLTFATPDHRCLLRMHRLAQWGDVMSQPILEQARRTGEDASGLGMGADGALALRCARPWHPGGRLLGYLELGVEVRPQLRKLAEDLHAEFVVLLRKQALEQGTFEAGRALSHSRGAWGDLPSMVVLEQSLPRLPGPLLRQLQSDSGLLRAPEAFPLAWEGKRLVVNGIPLCDTGGHTLGTLLFLQDVSGELATAQLKLRMQLRLAGLILLATLAALGWVTGRAETRFLTVLRRVETSEAAFRSLFQTMDDLIVVATEEGRIRFTNEACSRKLGYSAEELRCMTLADLRPTEPGTPSCLAFQALQRGEAEVCNLPMIRKDGGRLAVESRLGLGTWDGQPCLFVLSKDVSLQQAVLEKFQKMFQGSPALMAVATLPDRRFTEVNDAFLKRMGYEGQDVLGKTAEELGLFEEPRVLEQMVKALQRYGKVVNLPLRLRMRSGEAMDGLFSGEVMEHLGQRSLLTVYMDLTAQKQAEAELRHTVEKLAETIWELAEARDQALNAAEARSRFLANMSHEIRTPLNGVLGMAELLRDSGLSAEQEDQVARISRCGDSLLALLNDLLDFSKMEAGQLALETVSFDLWHLVFDAAELFRSNLVGHPVELLVDFDPSAPAQVMGDAGRFRQILNNLVSNAVKFTAQGHILIGVRAQPKPAQALHLTLFVQDTGIGIAPEQQARLFQPFVQAEASTARRFGGSGLGLTIVKRLAEAMGGEVSLASEAGVGSTFTVELELRQDPQAQPEPGTEALLSGLHVLLVDDLPASRVALRRQVQFRGARTEEAESGAEAWGRIEAALARGEPFDLVVVDLIMPGDMGGTALGMKLRADARCRATALAALTSSGVKGDSPRLAALGFDAYLLKPMQGDQLCQALAMAVRHARQQPQADLVTRYSLMGSGAASFKKAPIHLQGRILLVEDQETNQIVSRKLLERSGATVVVAASGFQALEAVAAASFDLVLMDCQMPDMDGLEATARIRASEWGTERHLPILAMTAHAMSEDRERCLAAGMDDYLTKPIHREAILQVIAHWLQAGAEGRDPAATGAPAPPAALQADPALGLDEVLFGKLLELYEQDTHALGQELLHPFLNTTAERIEFLKACLARKDFSALASGAHTIKGSARTLGLMGLGTLAERLEKEAKQTYCPGVEALLRDIQDLFGKARVFLASLEG